MYTRPRIIPVLLIDDRDLIKTVRFRDRTYLGDPVNAVKIFNRKYVDELAVLDIGATLENREPDYELLRDIAGEAFMPLSYGGGIKSVQQMKKLFSLGYEKIVVNTQLVDNPSLIKEGSSLFGAQSIVASIDAIKTESGYKCVVDDGKRVIENTPIELARLAESCGAGEIIINSVDNDGVMSGYDIDLVRDVSTAVGIPVVALGGAGDIADMKVVLNEGLAHAAAAGSMFVYYGKLKAVLITAPSEDELFKEGIYR